MALLTGTVGHDGLNVSTSGVAYEIRGLSGNDVIYGSAFDDLIDGGPGFDQMFGGAGNDTFLISGTDTYADYVRGDAGFDTILGGTGNDVFLFDLVTVERIDGNGGTDVLRGLDAPTFWNFSQTQLVGIAAIEGRGGADQIVASAGNDRVIGGAGNDLLDGSAGNDTAVFSGNFSLYTITQANGQLTVATNANSDGTDTLTNFEKLEFANGSWANGVFTPGGGGGNTPPVANADSYNATEDTQLAVGVATGLLANDSDPNGDPLTVTSFNATSARGGTVAVNANGSFTYTPAANVNGADSFSYTVSDGRGGSASATVNLTVAAVNDAPNALNDSYLATQNQPLTVTAVSGVLSNDTDPENNTLSVSAFSATSAHGGTVAMNANGSFTYTPPAGYTGPDSFTYTANDGTRTDQATVNITVNPVGGGSQFDAIIASMTEGAWAKVNTNQFIDVWTPPDQRTFYGIAGSPQSVILAWSSAAWDPIRQEYIFWGGGHANYEGNEVYTWSAVTLQWERASLPSALDHIQGVQYEAIDGVENAPISSHTYDNQEFLAVADRFITFGGAAAHTGDGFINTDGTRTGPYLWDPSKADPDKVGGTTGSQVDPIGHPEVLGGEMWENREAIPELRSMVNGTTDYAMIDGNDVVFVNDTHNLWMYTIPDLSDPSEDTWEIVGTVWDTYSGSGSGAYDPVHNIYVRTSGTEFTFWNLNNAGPNNQNTSFVPVDVSGEFQMDQNWGMEYDPVRDQFVLWNGDATVWNLNTPEQAGGSWTLTKAAAPVLDPDDLLEPVTPDQFTGVLGKWDYVASHDVFIGVTDAITGDVWIYKPDNWSPPDALV